MAVVLYEKKKTCTDQNIFNPYVTPLMSFKAIAIWGSDSNCSDRRLENSGLNHRCIDYLPPVHHLSLFANHLSFSSQHIFANPTVTIEGWKDFLEKWRWQGSLLLILPVGSLLLKYSNFQQIYIKTQPI